MNALYLFQNNDLVTESSERPKTYKNVKMIGGSSIPNGGFPPIYLCVDKVKDKKEEQISKERKYEATKSVSIKSIMENRRKTESHTNKN